MKERPILFSSPMVRAILEGRKTQTRRIMKNKPNIDPQTGDWLIKNSDDSEEVFPIEQWIKIQKMLHCPYGQSGDRLWLRETWRRSDWPTGHPYEYRATAKQDGTQEDGPWRPSLFMPREACRILLDITNVRVERLRDITDSDAISEGIESFRPVPGDGEPVTRYRDYMAEKKFLNGKSVQKFPFTSPIDSFFSLWEYINGPESVEQNPFVWAVEFNPIK